jgi:Lipase (class 3)
LPRNHHRIDQHGFTHFQPHCLDSCSEFSSTKFADDFYVDLLKSRSERSYRESNDLDSYTEYEEMTADLSDAAISIIAFDDEHETEELVYSIEVDHDRNRLTVCFRGSVNKADWATNLEIYMAEMPNPLRKYDQQDANLRVHNGFYKYLFQPSPVVSNEGSGSSNHNVSAYHEILQKHVLPALSRHSGYKLYVTGHSLGAALATLFGFRAAAEPDSRIPKPVTVVSIASPYVGDASWRSAHQLLEGMGKLRHLRVSSSKDVVPLHPKVSFRWQFYDSRSHVGSLFKHVGVNVRLLEEHGSFDVSYPKVRPLAKDGAPLPPVSNLFDAFLDELSRGWLQTWPANFCWNPVDYLTWPAHRLRDYHRRLKSCRRRLSSLELNDLYGRRRVVGDLVQRAKAVVPPRRTKTHVIFLAPPPPTP